MAIRPIAFNNSTKTNNSIKKNKIEIGLASDNYSSNPGGLTWFNGPDSTNQYVIYSDTFSLGMSTLANAKPVCWGSGDMTDTNVLRMINGLPTRNNQAPFTTIASALAWVASSSVFNMVSGTLDNIVTNGLMINLDASQKNSYPGSGTTWYDLSGNGNNAIMYNGLGYDGGGWMDFDGVNDYCVITYDSGSMGAWSTGQTVGIWMYHNIASGRRNPWNQAYGGYGTWTHENGGSINYYYGNAGSNTTPYTSLGSAAVPKNVWNYLCITRSASTISWYLNGSLVNTASNIYGALVNTTADVSIGSGYAGYWQGRMGAVQAYNRALTAAEVLQNYNAQKTKFGL
jgi:hypothetical protein